MDKFQVTEYDPQTMYSVPYTWGTVGIIYDKTAIDETEIDWDILWNEKYSDSVLMFDNPRDAFAIAETMLGFSLNTENIDELKKAAEKLTEQKKIVQAYVMDEIFDKMGAGEAVLAPYYAGDAITLMDDFDHIDFAIPKSGTITRLGVCSSEDFISVQSVCIVEFASSDKLRNIVVCSSINSSSG